MLASLPASLDGGNDHYINDVLITSNPANQCRCGYEIDDTGGIWMDSCGGLQCGTGLIALPALTGHKITWMFTTRCGMDNCSSHGWLIEGDPGTSINGWMSVNDWAGTNTGLGFLQLPATCLAFA